MTAVGEGLPPRLEIDYLRLAKIVSNHVYPVTGPDPPMYEVGACLL